MTTTTPQPQQELVVQDRGHTLRTTTRVEPCRQQVFVEHVAGDTLTTVIVYRV